MNCFTDGSSIFFAQAMKDFFKRFDIEHRVSSVSNPHVNLRSEGSVKSLKRMPRDIVGNSGSLDSDAVTEALLCHANTRCRILNKSPAEIAYGRCLNASQGQPVAARRLGAGRGLQLPGWFPGQGQVWHLILALIRAL